MQNSHYYDVFLKSSNLSIYCRYNKKKSGTIKNMCNHEYESVDARKHKELKLKQSQDTEEMEMKSCEAYDKIYTKSTNEDIHNIAAPLYERVN